MKDFWTRRREGVAREAQEADAVREAEAAAAREAVLDELPDAELLERLELPDPDTLSRGDDFTAFLAREVPERLRRRALRALWRTNPVLANVDGLVDHGEDYTDAATVPSVLRTSYVVGKGLAAHVRRMAELMEEAGDAPAPGPVEAPVSVVPPAPASVASPTAMPASAPAARPADAAAHAEEAGAPDGAEMAHDPATGATESPESTGNCEVRAPRGRMRFTFETEETAA